MTGKEIMDITGIVINIVIVLLGVIMVLKMAD